MESTFQLNFLLEYKAKSTLDYVTIKSYIAKLTDFYFQYRYKFPYQNYFNKHVWVLKYKVCIAVQCCVLCHQKAHSVNGIVLCEYSIS